MNILRGHVIIGIASILFHPHVYARNTLIKKTGKFILDTALQVSIIPAAFLSIPLNMITSAFSSPHESIEDEPPFEQQSNNQLLQTIGSTSQSTELADIPRVIHAAVTAIPQKKELPIYINLNLNNQQAATTATSDPQHPTSNLPPQLPWTTQSKNFITNSIANSISWIRSHKLRFTVISTISIYGGLQLYLWHLSRYLARSTCWSHWKHHCSLSDLYQIDHTEFLKTIMDSLQERYKENNPVTNAHRFIKEADHELCLLKRYQNIIHSLIAAHVRRFFFIKTSLHINIPDRIQRLVFIKTSVTNWLNKHQEKHTYEKLFTNSHATSTH